MSLETQGIKLFWRDILGFCRDIPEAPEKFEKKKFGFNSRPLYITILTTTLRLHPFFLTLCCIRNSERNFVLRCVKLRLHEELFSNTVGTKTIADPENCLRESVPENKGQKRHINFFKINFWPPPKTPRFGPPEKSLCASFPGKGRKKRDPHKLFRGILGPKNGAPNGPLSATKRLVYCSFLPLENKLI